MKYEYLKDYNGKYVKLLTENHNSIMGKVIYLDEHIIQIDSDGKKNTIRLGYIADIREI